MRVALYTRVSTEKQDTNLSTSAQLKALRDYALKNGYSIIREFVDKAETGRNTDRPAFREMVSLARRSQKPFDMILVWKYSRFARSRKDSIIYKAILRNNGVQVVSITEPFDDTPTGRLFEAIIESLDEFYSDNLGEEVTKGMRESASRGFYLSGRLPYGFRKIRVRDGKRERTKLKVDPCEASIVASMFDDVLNGKNLSEIAEELNRKGINGPHGKGWWKTSIYYMLTNEVYAGTLVWGRNSKRGLEPVRIENAFLAIVDKVTFDKVRDQLVKQKPGKPGSRKTATRSFISDDPRLGHCGESPSDQDTGNGQFPYCACNTLNKEVVGPCLAKYLNSFNIDNCVVNNTKEHILAPKNSNRPVDPVNEEIDNPSISYRDELVGISDEITNIKHHLEHLCASVEHFRNDLKKPIPIIDERECYQENCPTPKARIDSSLSDKCTGMAVSEMVRSFADDPDNSLIRNSLVDRKTFIQGFIKDVKVNGDEVMLTYIIPLSSARTSEENGSVLSN